MKEENIKKAQELINKKDSIRFTIEQIQNSRTIEIHTKRGDTEIGEEFVLFKDLLANMIYTFKVRINQINLELKALGVIVEESEEKENA